MTSSRISVNKIESWTPALDVKAVENGSLFVLNGRNFLFDVNGPKSGFGSTLVDLTPIDSSIHTIQDLQVGGRVIVVTSDGVYERRSLTVVESGEFTPSEDYFFKLASLTPQENSELNQYKWTSAYVGFGSFINHPGYGLFRLLGDSIEPHTAPGLEGPFIGIAESSGRLIVQTNLLTQYSSPDNANDFTPELGGSGFQITKQRVPGEPLAVTSFQGGFIVWTTAGVLLAEFVGGDAVFRFDRVNTDQLLSSGIGVETLPSGETLIVTSHGIFSSSPSQGLTPYTPQFNEYLRDLFANEDDVRLRLKYIKELDALFAQLYNQTTFVNRTFVYNVPSEKWGEFSENHRGIVKYGNQPGQFGFVDLDGYVHQFNDSPFVEKPDGTLEGLDSWIEMGYLVPADGASQADVEFEIQEALVSARETRTNEFPIIEEDWDGPTAFDSYNVGFYAYDQDWSQFGVDYYDIDFADPAEDEDWNSSSLPNVDWNAVVAGQRDFDWNDNIYLDDDWAQTPPQGVNTDYIIDWNFMETPQVFEDWDGESHFFNQVTYGFLMRSNMDGYEHELEIAPSLAVEKTKADLWTAFTYGHRHRVIFMATQPWEKYHVTAMSFSIHYAGQIS